MHFKYIEAAAKMQQFKEVERVCRDSTMYEPEKVSGYMDRDHLSMFVGASRCLYSLASFLKVCGRKLKMVKASAQWMIGVLTGA